MPVEVLLPKTIAMMVTFIMSIPLIPAFERPIIKEASKIRSQFVIDSSNKPSIG
jgi:hypothetical protein